MAERPIRILLADDERSILTLLSYPLRKDGYEVVPAADGGEALGLELGADDYITKPFSMREFRSRVKAALRRLALALAAAAGRAARACGDQRFDPHAVDRMSGRLTLRSRPGHTIFTLALPGAGA